MSNQKVTEWIFNEQPKAPGFYAVSICWVPREGIFPSSAFWTGEAWLLSSPIVAHCGPFEDAETAEAWAYENDMEAFE